MAQAKIPPSLAFLIRQRAYAAGEVIKAKNTAGKRISAISIEIERARHRLNTLLDERTLVEKVLAETIAIFETDVHRIDEVIRLHPLQIDPAVIEPVRSHESKVITAWGDMTRSIHKCLAQARGARRGITEIAVFAMIDMNLDLSEKEFTAFRFKIRHRLKTLFHAGRILKFDGANLNAGSWYAAVPEAMPQEKSVVRNPPDTPA